MFFFDTLLLFNRFTFFIELQLLDAFILNNTNKDFK